MGANEPVAPASLLQVAGTGRIVREKSLELWERLWEPKIVTLVNVHEHGRTLPLVAVGDNRIGKVSSSNMPNLIRFRIGRVETMLPARRRCKLDRFDRAYSKRERAEAALDRERLLRGSTYDQYTIFNPITLPRSGQLPTHAELIFDRRTKRIEIKERRNT